MADRNRADGHDTVFAEMRGGTSLRQLVSLGRVLRQAERRGNAVLCHLRLDRGGKGAHGPAAATRLDVAV